MEENGWFKDSGSDEKMIDDGKFGKYGGIFVPELIIPALEELEKAFYKYKDDDNFIKELIVRIHQSVRRL